MEKRLNLIGQTSIFIILAIIIIAVVIGVYFFYKSSSETNIEKSFSALGINAKASLVQDSIFNCIEDVSKDSLTVIGIQGGYYNPTENVFDLGWAFIPYYYDNGKFAMPENEIIERELGSYVDDNLELCLNDLSYEDFEIRYKESDTRVSIEDKDVVFEVKSNVIFNKDELSSEVDLGKYPVRVESALSDILEVADYITESHKEDPELICISCVADMAEVRNLYVDMLDFGDDVTTLIVISENYTSSEPYVYEFLNRYE